METTWHRNCVFQNSSRIYRQMLSCSLPSGFWQVPVFFPLFIPNFGSIGGPLTAADHLGDVKIKFMRTSPLSFGLLYRQGPQEWMSTQCQIPIYLLQAALLTLLCCERSTRSSLGVQTPIGFHHLPIIPELEGSRSSRGRHSDVCYWHWHFNWETT